MKKQNDSIAGGIAAILRANKTRFQHGDRVKLPTGQTATITEKGTEDAHEWGDRQGWRMAYRVRYDDNTVAQFSAAWLDKTAEPAQ